MCFGRGIAEGTGRFRCYMSTPIQLFLGLRFPYTLSALLRSFEMLIFTVIL